MMKIRGGNIRKNVAVEIGLHGNYSEDQAEDGSSLGSDGLQIFCRVFGATVGIEIFVINNHSSVPDVDSTQTEQQENHALRRPTLPHWKSPLLFSHGPGDP